MMPLPTVPGLAFLVSDWSPFLGPHWGNFGVRYYGLAYILGFVSAAWLLHRYARAGRSLLPAAQIADFMMALVLGVMIGGRLGYFIFYHPADLINPPWTIFMVWKGGMASHGGFIGVAVAIWWFARAEKIPLLHLADLVTSTASAGLFFGRIANFINGELWGKISVVPWAVIFPRSVDPGTPLARIPPRHPSQLYEAGLEGLVLLAYMQWRFWRSDTVKKKPGHLAGEFLIAYAVARIICEVFREPDADVTPLFGLSRGTFYSIFLVLLGGSLVAFSSRRRPAA